MVFSSLIFLFTFLPIVIGGNFLVPKKYRNYFLLLASFIFFAWGGVSYSILLIFSVLMNYSVGLLVNKHQDTRKAKIFLSIGVTLNLAVIGVFKYANFIFENLNFLRLGMGLNELDVPDILLPIGISFYTFQAISYLVDLYRKQVTVQKNLGDLALYIFLFPQLIAGPIIRYHDISDQIKNRDNNLDNFIEGVKRFVLGLARKVFIANQMAVIADYAFGLGAQDLSTTVAWIGIIAYALQIYFDFAGYSDMAIGLGRMFGFRFPENFNFPYIATSIKEFWRRWHISLSTWFRDYLYIPLGGNRVGRSRTYINLAIVFLLTGLWHGASWNFVIWGLFHGLFLVIERLGFDKVLLKIWRPFRHIYTLLIVLISWVFFRAETFGQSMYYLQAMFSLKELVPTAEYFSIISNSLYKITAIIAILSSTTIWLWLNSGLRKIRNSMNKIQILIYENLKFILILGAVVSTILLVSAMLVSNSYNPFIYYRF